MKEKKVPKLKKVAVLKVKKPQTVFNDKDPKDILPLTRMLMGFTKAVCRDVLDYTPEKFADEARLNLNTVHDELLALKKDRDNWRTRCQSIEMAFNASAPK